MLAWCLQVRACVMLQYLSFYLGDPHSSAIHPLFPLLPPPSPHRAHLPLYVIPEVVPRRGIAALRFKTLCCDVLLKLLVSALLTWLTAENCFLTHCASFSCQDELTSLRASASYLPFII